MKSFQGIATTLLTLAFAAATAVGAWWLVTYKPGSKAADKRQSPASVDKLVKEEELNTVTLTEEAEKRIGVACSAADKKAVRRVRTYGGEVAVPAGRTIVVAAPLGGLLRIPANGAIKAGQSVKFGQVIFMLTPMLTPDGQATLSASLADADGQVNNAKTQLELTKIALDRAKRVFKEGAGSQRQVDESDAAYSQASKTLAAVIARQSILKRVVGDAEAGTAAPIPIEAPEAGVLRSISALPGQNVPVGAPLFEVIDTSTVWIRVPLPVGDLDAIDHTVPAQVGKLSAQPGAPLRAAMPVAAPPSANPVSATVDVFYEMENSDNKLIPGQRLGVSVPLADARESLTVPWGAVVYDIHGGTWVYEQVDSHRYARRRVVVGYTVGRDAVLASGPAAGSMIVTAGAQELFGAETGFVK